MIPSIVIREYTSRSDSIRNNDRQSNLLIARETLRKGFERGMIQSL